MTAAVPSPDTAAVPAAELLREYRSLLDRYEGALKQLQYSDNFIKQATSTARAALARATAPASAP
jgi:hypothetical protein